VSNVRFLKAWLSSDSSRVGGKSADRLLAELFNQVRPRAAIGLFGGSVSESTWGECSIGDLRLADRRLQFQFNQHRHLNLEHSMTNHSEFPDFLTSCYGMPQAQGDASSAPELSVTAQRKSALRPWGHHGVVLLRLSEVLHFTLLHSTGARHQDRDKKN